MRRSQRYLVRWQPLDPKYIGALTLRGSYTEAFHAPTLRSLTPAGSQNFPPVKIHLLSPIRWTSGLSIRSRNAFWKPRTAAGSGLRIDCRSRLQSEMAQGPDLER